MKRKGFFMSVIGVDGKVTARVIDQDDRVGKGEAQCREGDEFNPVIGAVIAVCRAFGKPARDTCLLVAKTIAAARGAGKAKFEPDMTNIPVFKAKLGRAVLTANPVDFAEVRSFGVMGTPTKFKDVNGQPLFVGDLVIISRLEGCTRTGKKWVEMPGLHLVVDEDSDCEASKGQYIMGMCDACNAETGKKDRRFRVRKVKGWKLLEFGENHDGVVVTWDGSVEVDLD